MWSTILLRLLTGPFWTGLVVPFRVRSVGQTEVLNHLLKLILISFWNHANCSYEIGILDEENYKCLIPILETILLRAKKWTLTTVLRIVTCKLFTYSYINIIWHYVTHKDWYTIKHQATHHLMTSGIKPSAKQKKAVLDMTLNYIPCLGSSSGI